MTQKSKIRTHSTCLWPVLTVRAYDPAPNSSDKVDKYPLKSKRNNNPRFSTFLII